MKPPPEQCAAWTSAVCCDVAADAVVRVGLESLPELRRNPGLFRGEPLPPSFLKHADEQTVAGLAAVSQAIHTSGLRTTSFRDWGVVAAPRFLGRPAMAAALQRFQAEGAWGVSPHLIPHRSLHSISGTVSQALKIHGPNFGVGGGPGGAAEALRAAMAMLESQKLPGVWLVLTCLYPERSPDPTGHPTAGSLGVGLAVALMPVQPNSSRIRLRLVCSRSAGEATPEESSSSFDLLRLESLLESLRGDRGGEKRVVQLLDACTRIELSRPSERSCASAPRNTLGALAHPRSPVSLSLRDSATSAAAGDPGGAERMR